MTTKEAGKRPARRKLQYHSKAKTGCWTCRIRRVKCGEEKPSCHRCTSTGRTCDGYLDHRPSPPPPEPRRCSPPAALTNHPCSTALEQRLFEWFRQHTVPNICGFFADETYDHTALQLYFSTPAVRHTITAFGALHHELYYAQLAGRAGANSNVRTHLPGEQYALALKELQMLVSQEDVPLEVVLVCSLLLVQFEATQRSFVPAMLHAEKALALVCTGGKKVDEGLLRTMMRFDEQSARYSGRKAPRLLAHALEMDRVLPSALRSPVEARYLVNTYSTRLYAFTQAVGDQYIHSTDSISPDHLAESHILAQTLHRLSHLIQTFLQTHHSHLPIRSTHGLQILLARTKILYIFASTTLTPTATAFDAHLFTFTTILTLCQNLMTDDRADRSLFVLKSDEGLVHTLYILSTYCRESAIRHQAFDLLRELPGGVGRKIWHADVVIRTAKVVIEFEEDGQSGLRCGDVPEGRRVHGANFQDWEGDAWFARIGGPLWVRTGAGEWVDLREVLGEDVLRGVEAETMVDSPRNKNVIA